MKLQAHDKKPTATCPWITSKEPATCWWQILFDKEALPVPFDLDEPEESFNVRAHSINTQKQSITQLFRHEKTHIRRLCWSMISLYFPNLLHEVNVVGSAGEWAKSPVFLFHF